jgi:hypothetical protein
MEKKWVIITEIYYEDKKISRERLQKSEINSRHRNQIIRTVFNSVFGKMKMMDVYSYISLFLMEKYNIQISERSIMRIIDNKKFE